MRPDARVALYYAPEPDDPLFPAGARWLGRDPDSGAKRAQPPVEGIAEFTAEPRLYGFHATLKPPMRLREGRNWFEFLEATRALAATIAPFDLPPLAVADLRGFLALRETRECPALQALCDACVERLDAFRAPPSSAELERRRGANLSAEADAMLTRWGYPWVFRTWFFHMTLTRRLDPADAARIRPLAEDFFAEALTRKRRVESLCLFTQLAPGQDFVISERVALGG